jgi:hypothetical protein
MAVVAVHAVHPEQLNMPDIRCIAISRRDAPGLNAAIRAAVKSAILAQGGRSSVFPMALTAWSGRKNFDAEARVEFCLAAAPFSALLTVGIRFQYRTTENGKEVIRDISRHSRECGKVGN